MRCRSFSYCGLSPVSFIMSAYPDWDVGVTRVPLMGIVNLQRAGSKDYL